MTEFLIYDLKVAVLLLVFWLFYRLLMDRAVYHWLNRIVLLLTMALSLILPLCIITIHKQVLVQQPNSLPLPISGNNAFPGLWQGGATPVNQQEAWDMGLVVGVILIVGILLRLIIVGRSYYKLKILISNSEKHPQDDGTVMAVTEEPVAPFSWMRTIVMNRSDYESLTTQEEILAHERGHINCHHSWDMVFVEVLTALQWFNPVVWLLRKDLRIVHESEADQAVLSQGFAIDPYIHLLIRKATGLPVSPLANGMSVNMIKKRVIMMKTNKQKSRYVWLRALYVLPIVAISLAATAKVVVEYKPITNSSSQPTQKSEAATVEQENVAQVSEETVVKDEFFVSFSPTLTNRAHPKVGGAYTLQIPEELQQKMKEKYGSENLPDGLNLVDGTYKTAYSKATTIMKLDGKVFDEHSLPKVRIEDVVNIEESQNADGRRVVNIITKGSQTKTTSTDDLSAAEIVDDQAGEEISGDDDKIFDIVEEMPSFPGGMMKLMQFLQANMKYPKEATAQGLQGRVIVQFVVEKDGSLTNLKIVKSVEPKEAASPKNEGTVGDVVIVGYGEPKESASTLLDDEALRVVRLMPKWTPGKLNGKVVRTKFNIPLVFRLN
ncbi:MAG: M56 family metallopeptidase [Prevotella sp.]|nr:M56 family metallopeptidase [Prevotella sp.]